MLPKQFIGVGYTYTWWFAIAFPVLFVHCCFICSLWLMVASFFWKRGCVADALFVASKLVLILLPLGKMRGWVNPPGVISMGRQDSNSKREDLKPAIVNVKPTPGFVCPYYIPFKCGVSIKEAAPTILKVFVMTQPGFEPPTSQNQSGLSNYYNTTE